MHLPSFIAFLFISITSFLPANLFMNAKTYYFYKLRNVTADIDPPENYTLVYGEDAVPTELQKNYEAVFAVTANLATLFGAVANSLATNRLSNGFRVLTGHAIVLLALLPTFFFTFVNTDNDQVHFFWLTMVFSSFASFGCMGLIGCGIMGLAAMYPPVYVQSVMVGQAVSAVISATMSILCQMFTSTEILNGKIYFFVALIWTALSVAAYFYLVNNSYTKHLMERSDQRALINEEDDEDDDEDFVPRVEGGVETKSTFQVYSDIFKQSFSEMATTFFVLGTTLLVFPAVIALVATTSENKIWKSYFTSVCCFLLFACMDAIGRLTANRVSITLWTLQKLSFFRFLLIPLLLVCNIVPRTHTPTLLPYDGAFMVILAVFAVSHGFCLTQATLKAVSVVEPQLRESAGGVLSLVCVVSSVIAAILSLGIMHVV